MVEEVGVETDTPQSLISIKESFIEKDIVLEKFREGDLLIRVMDSPGVRRDVDGLELDTDTWEEELDFMISEDGMQHVSTTLVMEGKGIALYHKPFGLIIDAGKVNVEHVASSDSGSTASETGGLRANPTDLTSLEDLKAIYRSRVGTEEMNEVNVGIKDDAVLGLVIRKGVRSASTLAGLEVARKVVEEKLRKLPVYEYDEKMGEMNNYNDPDRGVLLSQISPTFRPAYEKYLT